jgi:diguanylate cyclase (GGDEF)-like protein
VKAIETARQKVTVSQLPAELAGDSARHIGGCLVVIYPEMGPHYGRRLELRGTLLTIGRAASNDIVLPADCVSRRHCHIERDEKGWFVSDLDSKNGTFVGDGTHHGEAAIRRALLRPGCQLRVGDTIFKFLSGQEVELQFIETAYRMAIEDPLTGLANRRAFDKALDRDLARARRSQASLCVALLDLDHFKRVNDSFGHGIGDRVLKRLGRVLSPCVRVGDVFARRGGEEFALLLPETSMRDAIRTCERLREAIDEHVFEFEGTRVPVTISIGVAEFDVSMETEEVLACADQQLYAAKRAGRNRVLPRPEDA